MASHPHSHSDGDDAHDHDPGHGHDHTDDIEPALQNLLYQQIDFDNVRTLNESEPGAGIQILKKTWAQRLEQEPELESDADEQLIIFVPFAGSVKLHSIILRTPPSPSGAKTLKVFLNRDDLDFSTASDLRPIQTIEVSQTSEIQELQVKRALFGNTYNLSLFVEGNYGDDVTRLSYLGFKGEFMELSRKPVEVLYEMAANPKDHVLAAGIGEKGAMGTRHGM